MTYHHFIVGVIRSAEDHTGRLEATQSLAFEVRQHTDHTIIQVRQLIKRSKARGNLTDRRRVGGTSVDGGGAPGSIRR